MDRLSVNVDPFPAGQSGATGAEAVDAEPDECTVLVTGLIAALVVVPVVEAVRSVVDECTVSVDKCTLLTDESEHPPPGSQGSMEQHPVKPLAQT